MKVDLHQVEEAAKELYIRALKLLPPDIKQGFDRLSASETDAGARRVLGTMMKNIAVAEDRASLLCQDTGIPIYNVRIGRGVEVDGYGLKEAIRRGCARSTRDYSFRSSIVHPTTRVNDQTSTGRGVPTIATAVPGFENTGWFGIVAPRGTPKEIIDKVYQDTKKALLDPVMKEKFFAQGLAPVGDTPEEMGRAMKEETQLWARVVRERKIQVK